MIVGTTCESFRRPQTISTAWRDTQVIVSSPGPPRSRLSLRRRCDSNGIVPARMSFLLAVSSYRQVAINWATTSPRGTGGDPCAACSAGVSRGRDRAARWVRRWPIGARADRLVSGTRFRFVGQVEDRLPEPTGGRWRERCDCGGCRLEPVLGADAEVELVVVSPDSHPEVGAFRMWAMCGVAGGRWTLGRGRGCRAGTLRDHHGQPGERGHPVGVERRGSAALS
jgi:hypothetical protein